MKLREMMEFFDNETEMGKLYINYSMLEACWHIRTLPLMIIDYNVELTLSMYDLKFVLPTKLWLK